jgi:hypothetical protein
MVMDLGVKGFHKELIDNCLLVLRHEIAGLMGHFRMADNSQVVEEYQQDSSWLGFV